MKMDYRATLRACYFGYITQAIVNNLAPLLFVIFQDEFGLSFEQVGRLVLLNFSVQIAVDLLSVKLVDRIGYRVAAVLAHLFAVLGLAGMSFLPNVLPSAYAGLCCATVIYALGGGLLEVLVSPIVEALPGEEKESAMSLLHSFYCWGQVAVVLISTLLLKLVGGSMWRILPLIWTVIPLYNLFCFCRVPLCPLVKEGRGMSVRELLRSPLFLLILVMMMCSGASELTMSQWSSLFAERGLGISKTLGDLLGPCLFAVLMGAGRACYGIWGGKLDLRKVMLGCGLLCVICYLVTVFSPWPLLSLAGCAVCGLSVSMMWPGSFSIGARRFPSGGTAMFAIMAIFGDIGGSVGPWAAGAVSDFSQNLDFVQKMTVAIGDSPEQIGLKAGLLLCMVFPLVMVISTILLRDRKKQKVS